MWDRLTSVCIKAVQEFFCLGGEACMWGEWVNSVKYIFRIILKFYDHDCHQSILSSSTLLIICAAAIGRYLR